MTLFSFFHQYPWLLYLSGTLQVLFLIHAVITQRSFYWIIALLIGSYLAVIAYLVLEILPEFAGSSRRSALMWKTKFESMKPLDMRIRDAQAELSESDTLINRANLAALQARAGRPDEAQTTLAPLLGGIYADDPIVLLSLAELELSRGNAAIAEKHLGRAQLQTSAGTRTRALTLLAQAQEAQGKVDDADQTYRLALISATTEEPRARYAQFLLKQGRRQQAQLLLDSLAKTEQQATRLYKRQEREWFQLASELRRGLKRDSL